VTVISYPILMLPGDTDTPAVLDGERLVDRYGNEIETAVGDYRIDVLGEIYERHAPDTEVAKLSAPEI